MRRNFRSIPFHSPWLTLCAALSLGALAPAQQLVRSITGPAANSQYGKACLRVPDQNNDGYADLLVGSPGFNQERGAVFCISGAYLATGSGVQTLWSLAPTANQGDRFGAVLAEVGDVTADGVADFLVGQPGYDITGFNDVGAVRLVSGATHVTLSLISGVGTSAVFGSAIAVPGDLDYDNKSEVLIGAPGFNTSTSHLYLLLGSSLAISGSISTHFVDDQTYSGGEEFGASLASGFHRTDFGTFVISRFVVGSPGNDGAAGANVGTVVGGFVTLGGSPITLEYSYHGSAAGERLGSSIDVAHDYDGDGFEDIVVGVPNALDASGKQAGRVVVLSRGRLNVQAPPYEIHTLKIGFTSPFFDYHFGAAVRACGDLNNDGVGDILVGAPDYSAVAGGGQIIHPGLVSIYSGASGARWNFIAGSNTDLLGDALAAALDDLDGDGFDEFVVAGSASDAGGTDAGVIRCYRLFPIAPKTYCTGKLNSAGCTPAIGFTGTPSATSSAPFQITATNFINQKTGMIFYSHDPTTTAFQGGFKCAGNPVRRTGALNSGGSASGSDCTGTYSRDFNARIQSGVDVSLVAGAEVYAQWWSRDPGSASHTGLSNALSFLIHP